ncbi:tRNA-U20-dihydrouridine synthase [Lachnospiraceae bacterium RM5]|nr:tRNA-U20-dihydrouridine synthase [Lachnospiraceae bacterium RM5]
MNIGKIKLKNNIVLGPMAGVTDLVYRSICKEMGCGLTVSEMVSAKAVLYNNKNTKELLATNDIDVPRSVQLFGSNPDIMADMAVKVCSEYNFDIVDVNMGCPVPKVVNNHEGSALMREPELVEKILTNMSKKLEKIDVPLTVKIRKGFNDSEVNAVEIAKIAQYSGVKAICVHGRTREEYYSGKADLDIIKAVKESVNIPVIGNGDIVDGKSAKHMLDYTGCDGIMIGRAAKGNPWIFREVESFLKDGTVIEKPDNEEICEMIRRHGLELIELKGEYTAMREMRKHVAWYTSGMRYASNIRKHVNEMESYDDLVRITQFLQA